MVEVNLNIKIQNGRVTLKGKTYNQLNDDEKLIMGDLIKELKSE